MTMRTPIESAAPSTNHVITVISAPAISALRNDGKVGREAMCSASRVNGASVPSGKTPSAVRITAISTPPTMLTTSATAQSSPSFNQDDSRSRSSPATGMRKFSVNSSDRPTTMKTKPMPKAIAPTSSLALPAIVRAASAYAATPIATSKPPTSAVAASSIGGRARRRSPSFFVSS